MILIEEMNMNVILGLHSLKESWFIFQKSMDSLSIRQQKIAIIAAVTFSAIGMVLLICRCWGSAHVVKNYTQKPNLKSSTVSVPSPGMNKLHSEINELERWKEMSLSEESNDFDDENVLYDDVDRFVSTHETPYIDDKADAKSNTTYKDATAQCKISDFFED